MRTERTMVSRRGFLQWTAGAMPFLGAGQAEAFLSCADLSSSNQENSSVPKAGSDVGTLFPFISSQAVKKDFPLSFLADEFKDMAAWKRQARGKLLDLLHYAPPKCEPRPEVVEKVDKGDHIREKILFNTTPDIRVPA